MFRHRTIILISLLSLLASLAYAFYFQITPQVDARGYDGIAWNIVSGNGYRENIERELVFDLAIGRVGPLYQYFLAGHYYLFGHRWEPVWISQAILHALTVWLVYLTCLLVFKSSEQRNKIGLIAAAIVGFYPDLIEISAMLMMETFYLFWFVLAIYLFFRLFNRLYFWPAVLIGLVFGLASLTRPTVLFLIPVVLFYYFTRKKRLMALTFLLTLILVFIPWTVHNYQVYGKFSPFGAAGAYNFWIGNYHGANGEQEPPAEAREFIKSYGVINIQQVSIRKFFTFIADYPLEFVKLSFLRVNKYFSVARPMGFWFYQTGWSQLAFLASSALASIFLFIAGLSGLIKAFKLKNVQLNYLIAFTFITPLIIFATVVETRYRFQIYPLLAVFAAYFIARLSGQKKFWLNKTLWLIGGIVLANGFLDLFLSLERFKERLGRFF